MKERLLNYLVCPTCRGSLRCDASERADEEIKEGRLLCEGCKKTYPIRDFIPRFVDGDLYESAKKTQRAWGYQWNVFDELHDSYPEQFLDWIAPIGKEFFRDKVVLDAGCGMGRFTRLAAEFGAREVIGFDISRAVEAARKSSADISNVHIIQADMFSLPLKQDFDFIYSIGVLHHLAEPYRGFKNLCRLLNKNGAILAWVYGYENNELIAKYLSPIREKLTSRLPLPCLYFLAFLLNIPFHLILKAVYRPVATNRLLKFFRPFLPYHDYLFWLAKYNFRHNHQVIFDHLAAPIAYYIPREEIVSWFEKEGLEGIRITSRNNNSWRGFGYRKEPS